MSSHRHYDLLLNCMPTTFLEVLIRPEFESYWESNFSGSAGVVSGHA